MKRESKINYADDTTQITTYYLSDEKQNELVCLQRGLYQGHT